MRIRLVIYFHYDPRGQADTACRFAVQAVQEAAQAVLFVTNGKLNPESRAWAETRPGLTLLERENAGFDVGAYKAALQAIGREGLEAYDEIVLMNYTLAGPVRPLAGFFAAMEGKDLDFWGLSRHYAMRSRRFGGKNGVVPEHIQSHLIAVRRRMYADFWAYWQNIPLPQSYEESVACHEARFTAHFAALGYRWDTYLDGERWRGVFLNPIMACPARLIAEEDCPFFKRRSFFTPYGDELRRTDGLAARRLCDLLRAEGGYPIGELLRSLLPGAVLADFCRSLHLRAVLPAASGAPVQKLAPGRGMQRLEPGRFYWIELPLPAAEPAATYEAAARWDAAQASAAAAWLAARPLIGVIGPALPPFPGCTAGRQAAWRPAAPAVAAAAKEYGVPLSSEAPPLPAGCAVLRGDAFPGGLPPYETLAEAWALPLAAQAAGYATALADDPAALAARADNEPLLLRPQFEPAAALHALARSLRRRKGEEDAL